MKHVKKVESSFARHLLAEWQRLGLPVTDVRLVVAVSGGADSVALLLAVDELVKGGRLAVEVTVAHLDHGLRGEAGGEDALWVGALADSLKFEVVMGQVDVKERAVRTGDNLEQAARRARYEFLAEVAAKSGARVVLTGHTMDDQAETVLLRLLRGSGAEGLSGMETVRALDESSNVLLARPLLGWARRAETQQYCRERNVAFRVDAMNEDESFARVRVRRQLLPLMETFNPRVVESLSRAAELLREDAAVLKVAAAELVERASEEVESAGIEKGKAAGNDEGASVTRSLSVDILRDAPAAVRRRALRLWLGKVRGDLRRLELVHLLGVEKLIA
ncbi:MAG TPA: tRNA lysidine(34) synthetase TilS, partial [Pyrinomonadaceae bacterium]